MSVWSDLASLVAGSDPFFTPGVHHTMTDNALSDILISTDKAVEARTATGTAIAEALAAPPPAPPASPYSTHTMTMLRQLSEQREHFHDVAAEYDTEIAALAKKRDDALHAAAMAEAGMVAMESAS